jgi:predicted DNA-binding transcriptional regulator YafY
MGKAATNILQVLTKAIRERRLVALRYHDQKEIRVVEPHAIYTDERSSLVLDSYQVRGYTSSGRPAPFWRPFRMKEIATVQVMKETFTPRTAEGFSSARLKYKHGLVAIVEAPATAFNPMAANAAAEMGPPRPLQLRRSF